MAALPNRVWVTCMTQTQILKSWVLSRQTDRRNIRAAADVPAAAATACAPALAVQEVACVVDRLYRDPKSKEGRVGEAASYSQYQELKACTFKPEINREVPKTQVRVVARAGAVGREGCCWDGSVLRCQRGFGGGGWGARLLPPLSACALNRSCILARARSPLWVSTAGPCPGAWPGFAFQNCCLVLLHLLAPCCCTTLHRYV